MREHEEITISHDAFQFISLVLGGAIAVFENEGQSICEKLDEEDKGHLQCAMTKIGKALVLAKDKADTLLLHNTLY